MELVTNRVSLMHILVVLAIPLGLLLADIAIHTYLDGAELKMVGA